MADDILEQAADKESADRLKQINMVTSNVAKLKSEMNQKISSVETRSSKISSISSKGITKLSGEMGTIKRSIGKQGEEIKSISRQKGVKEVQSSVNSMLKSMGRSVDYLAQGVKQTTTSTARITRDTLSQYGKAISEDISVNRQNVLGMAIAKSSPIFGYFVAKFMDTEVYSQFVDKIKGKFKQAFEAVVPMFKGIFSTLGEKIKGLRYAFRKKPTTIAEKAREAKKIPKLQEGGVVTKSGKAVVHKGEVVMSIDRLLGEIDKKVEKGTDTALARKFVGGLTVMSQNMARMEQYVQRSEERKPKEKRGLIEDFINSWKKAKDVRLMRWQDRLLKATLELKVALVGTTERWRLAWHETLVQHPTFRNIIALSKGFHTAISFPMKYLFKAEGGYLSEIKRVTKGKNVFKNIANALCMMYAQWSPKIDLIAKSVSKLEGKKYKEAVRDVEGLTRFEKLKAWAKKKPEKKKKKRPIGETLLSTYASIAGLSEGDLKKAGLKTLDDILPGNLMKKAGITKEVMSKKWTAWTERTGVGPALGKVKGFAKGAIGKVKGLWKGKTPELQEGGGITRTGRILAHKGELVLSVKDLLRVIGTFSRNTAEFVKAIKPLKGLKGVFDKETLNRRWKQTQRFESMKIKLARAQTASLTGIKKWTKKTGKAVRPLIAGFNFLKRRLLGVGKTIWKMIFFGFSLVKSLLGGTIGKLAMILGTVIVGSFTKVLPFLMKSLLHPLTIGLAWGIKDAFKGARKAKEWEVSKTAGAIGGFLGGTKDRKGAWDIAKGATKGAAKGALIGAGLGMVVPLFGPPIGAAIGAIAGGVLGAIGGKNIAKGLQAMAGYIKKAVKGIWAFITYPFTMVSKAITMAKEKILKAYKEKGMLGAIKMIGKAYISLITWPLRMFNKVISRAKEWALEKLEKIPGIGRLVKWARERNKPIEDKALEAQLTAKTMQRGGIIRGAVKGRLHPNEMVVPLPPGVADTVASSILHPSELAKRQAGMDISRSRAIANPLLASDKATRDQFGKGNANIISSINSSTSSVNSSSQTVNNNMGGPGGVIPGNPYASQVILGDIS